MKEKWKTIRDSPIEISSRGRVRNKNTKEIKKQLEGNNGYLSTSYFKKGKTKRGHIHTLVLVAFKGPRPRGCEGHHKNSNRLDNEIDNLEWVPLPINRKRKLLKGEMNLLKKILGRGVVTQRYTSKMFRVSESMVSNIKYGKEAKGYAYLQ